MSNDSALLGLEGERVHARAVAGDFSELGRTLRALESTTHPVARGWSLALRAQLWLAEPRYGCHPSIGELADFVDGPPLARKAAVLCIADCVRAFAIGSQGSWIGRLAPLVGELADGLGDDARAVGELVLAWQKLFDGDASAGEAAEVALERAAKARLGAERVEAQALRALASGSLELARRASLMARSEGLPQAELLAHLVLARARRLARQPHLSLRILEALGRVATAPWQAWIAWEWLMAGGRAPPLAPELPATPARSAALALAELLQLAARGDRAGYEHTSRGLSAAVADAPHFAAEVRVLQGAFEPWSVALDPELAAWRAGKTVLTPPALHGLRLRPFADDASESASAYVVLHPDGRAARLLHWGVELLDAPSLARVKQSHRAQGRVETLLAVLALAGREGLLEADCFHETYGFPFVPEVHRGVFDVLLHRARATLGELASIEREAGRLSLSPAQALLIPDPRVSQRITDRVLRLLAQRGTANAKDAASELGISLRAAQRALSELADSGACDAHKEGRLLAYVVEDTVFSEPTERLRPDQLTGLTRIELA